MALKKDIIINQWGRDLEFKDCYISITDLIGSKEHINIRVAFFTDETKKFKLPVEQVDYFFTPSMEDNFIKQGYNYLKTLNEFANAIDC